jgi:predicted transcriptional regulator
LKKVCIVAASVCIYDMSQPQQTPAPTNDLISTLVQLCNQTNLRIIQLLYTEKITMNFVVSRKLQISSQLTSKRMKALVSVGLVSKEQIFKNKIYRLNQDRFSELGLSVELLVKDLA